MNRSGWCTGLLWVLVCSVAGASAGCGPPRSTVDLEIGTCVIAGRLTLDTIDVLVKPGGFGADLYETLFRLPCDGEPLAPVLATHAAHIGPQGTWRVGLRTDVHFTDGTPLTASLVKASWLAREGSAARPWADSVAASVRVVNDSTLEIRFLDRGSSAADVLADPSLAISKGGDAHGGWGLGTGRYAARKGVSTNGVIAVPVAQTATDRLPTIRYLKPLPDPRDALDRSVGLLLARAPVTVAYARSLPHYAVRALDADRIYVVVAPSRRGANAAAMPLDMLQEFGRRSVFGASVQSRAAWWSPTDACPPGSASQIPSGDLAEVAYDQGDPMARDIAERLVALGRSGSLDSVVPGLDRLATPLHARAYDKDRFEEELATGASVAFVLPVARFPFETCTATHDLQRRMPWTSTTDLEEVLVALVETGAFAITREGIGPVVVDWDRSVHLAIARR